MEKVNVAIIGAGPAGIGAALGLARRGIKSVLLIERQNEIGGIPSLYKKKQGSVVTFLNWVRGRIVFGEEYAHWLSEKLAFTGVNVWLKTKVLNIEPKANKITLVNSTGGKMSLTANAVILACGARESNPVEMGWLMGSRPARLFYSKSLLELLDQHNILPLRQPIIIGSDLNAYAAAAKLKIAGAPNVTILANRPHPKTAFLKRLYFRCWKSQPVFREVIKSVKVVGTRVASAVELDNGQLIPCDGIVLCGDLIPNSELALASNLQVEMPSRKPIDGSNYQLSEPGWFATGNMLGGFHGAEWCYFNGLRVARAVAMYLRNV